MKRQWNRIELVTILYSGQAYTIQTGRGGRSMTIPPADKSLLGRAAPCCGSVVNVPQDLRFLTGTFTRRSARAPVLHISDVAAFVGANSNDIMPPSTRRVDAVACPRARDRSQGRSPPGATSPRKLPPPLWPQTSTWQLLALRYGPNFGGSRATPS